MNADPIIQKTIDGPIFPLMRKILEYIREHEGCTDLEIKKALRVNLDSVRGESALLGLLWKGLCEIREARPNSPQNNRVIVLPGWYIKR